MFEHKYDMLKHPYHLIGCPMDDAFNKDLMHKYIRAGDYDAVFMSADCGVCDEFFDDIIYMKGQKDFSLYVYIPLDCDIIGPEPFRIMTVADYAATYSDHSKGVLKRILPNVYVNVICLGCDTETFHPISLEERREIRSKLFNVTDDTFLVLNVNRNQWRKDIARSMKGFHLFHGHVPDSLLYLHMKQNDVGGSLPTYAKMLGMKWEGDEREVYFASLDFKDAYGVDRRVLNQIYNIADVYISSSTGEGWGLCTTDAMCCKLPVIVPRNTANLDLIGENERGYYIECGGDDYWSMPYGMTNNPRDIISCRHLSHQLGYVHQHREESRGRAEAAYEWCKINSWKKFQDEWFEVLRPW
jgi:glycosyltransferase involved in cell wall biosynthesis